MSKITFPQHEFLNNFIENNPALIQRKSTNDFTAKKRQEMWNSLTLQLNSLSVCEKPVEK